MTGTFHSIFNSFWFLIEQRETKFCERNKEIEREEEKKEKKNGRDDIPADRFRHVLF